MIFSCILTALSIFMFYRGLFFYPTYTIPETSVPLSAPKFNKLVYVVVDALRFDGMVPVKKEGLYYNKLTIMHDKRVKKQAFLSISGIPTATKPRIVSLLTGKPTVILQNLSSFFNSYVKDDNIFNKIAGRQFSFSGDECWTSNFSQIGDKANVFCTFKKYNLVNEENGVFKLLMPKIPRESGTGDDFVFAHFISIDSYGHQYSIFHPKIEKSIERIDNYLWTIYNQMSDDTLLVVLSDHGALDNGAHGGCSEPELASSCAFISKKELEITAGANHDEYEKFVSFFYNIKQCNKPDDWLQTCEPYNVIYQYDILPTICYLTGLPIPSSNSGNIIPYFDPNIKALELLAKAKEIHLAGCYGDFTKEYKKWSTKKGIKDSGPATKEEWEAYNYFLSHLIFSQYGRTSNLLIFSSLGICLLAVLRLISFLPSVSSYIPAVFSIIMVSHSMWAFASEDYYWFANFLFEYPYFSNLFAFIFYVKIPGRTFFEGDHMKLDELFPLGWLVKHFSGIISPIFFLILFFVFRLSGIRIVIMTRIPFVRFEFQHMDLQIFSKILHCLPQSCFIFLKLLDIAEERDINYTLLAAFPNMESLIVMHFSPYNSLFLLFILPNLDFLHTPTAKYALLSLLPYLYNLEKAFQSVDFQVFFTFSKEYEMLSVVPSSIVYFGLLRLILICNGPSHNFNNVASYGFAMINIIGLATSFACSWFFRDHLVFHTFFFSRLIFVTGFSILDILIETIRFHIFKTKKAVERN